MRARSWIALGGLALACGGTSFSSTGDDGGGGSGNNAGGNSSGGKASTQGGTLGKAGHGVGGNLLGGGGKLGTAGTASSAGKTGVAGGITTGGNINVGGDVTTGGGVALGGDTASAGAGPDPIIDKSCPLGPPTSDHACTDGLTCSYGNDIRASCRSRAKCDNGTWSFTFFKCIGIEACNAVVQGTACDAAPSCTIQGSIFCACTGCTGMGPCSNQTVWLCASGPGTAGCPELIPNEGQACQGNASCTYGSCSTGEKVTAACNGATWGWNKETCPL